MAGVQIALFGGNWLQQVVGSGCAKTANKSQPLFVSTFACRNSHYLWPQKVLLQFVLNTFLFSFQFNICKGLKPVIQFFEVDGFTKCIGISFLSQNISFIVQVLGGKVIICQTTTFEAKFESRHYTIIITYGDISKSWPKRSPPIKIAFVKVKYYYIESFYLLSNCKCKYSPRVWLLLLIVQSGLLLLISLLG